ncbi:MAG: TetR/AcrR family transcriptional regulator [Thermomicrobiales bacterium]
MQDEDGREEISESRRRVLDAANTLFVEHGFKAISMQQIANAAQINKATLYHHFRSKEELFAAVVLEATAQSKDDISRAIAEGGTPAEQLARAALQIFARTKSDFGRLMMDVHEQMEPELRTRILSEQAMPWEIFRAVFEEAERLGDLPDVDIDLGISLFIGMAWGQIWMRKIEVIDQPLDEALALTIVQVLFTGLRATFAPTGVPAAISS